MDNKQCKDRTNVEFRNNEISEENEYHEKIFGTRDELFIVESTNVTDKRIIDPKAGNSNESVVDKLRHIKQQTSKRTRYKNLCDLNDAKISSNTFFESARVLDSVCNSTPTTSTVNKVTRSLGLVPFVVLERCDVDKWKSPIHSGSATRWSLEEDNEEDIFADVKDDAENTVEFSQWEYDLPKSPEHSFHGFSPRKIQYSKNENERYKQWIQSEDTMKIKEHSDTLPLLGFPEAEITSSRRVSDDWRYKTEKYFSNDAFDRAYIQECPLNATRISSDYFVTNEIVSDKHPRSPYKKAQGLLDKDTEYTNNEREKSTCKFTTVRGCLINVSQAALKKAEIIYAEETLSINNDACSNNNLKDSAKSEYPLKFPTYPPSSTGFLTAGGRSISISKAALKKAEMIYSEEASSIKNNSCDSNDSKDLPNPECLSKLSKYPSNSCGFSTASGRSISVSEAALKKAETIYSEEVSNIKEDSCVKTNLKDLPELEKSLESAKCASRPCGFSTAGGRSISISKEALKKAETLYSKEASSIEDNVCNDGYLKDLPKSENLSKPTTSATSSFGFSTAGGRSIVISKAALKKSEMLYSEEASSVEENVCNDGYLKDLPKSENLSKPTTSATNSFGFSTAGGRSIVISKAALKKAEMLYSEEASRVEVESCDNSNEKNLPEIEKSSKFATCAPSTLGFSTAGGRSITVSKAALKKAETIYSEEALIIKVNACLNSTINDLRKSENSSNLTTLSTSTDFTTTGPSRKRVYSEVDNCEAGSSTCKTPKYGKENTIHRLNANVGFATARGQALKVSETALPKAKALLDENEPIGDPGFISETVISTTKSNASEPKSSTVEQVQLPADLDNFESIDFDDFVDPIEDDELSKKRKIDNEDEETPLRGDVNWKHKRGRYANELQGKKLFFEDSNFEDNAPVEKNTRIVTTTTILEDKEYLNGPNVREQEKPSYIKTETENMTLRKPMSPKVGTKTIQKTTEIRPGASTSSNRAIGLGRNSLDDQPEAIPDDLEFDSQFSDDEFCPLLGDFILKTMKIMEARLAMTRKQDEIIRGKRRTKPQHCDGYLYKLRTENSDKRISWQELTEGAAPQLRQISNESLENDVCFITSNSAASYSFCCADLFGSKNAGLNAEGIKVGDDAFLILDEKNRAGVCEFERAFLASPGVDPNLVPTGWVKNHYRWIVWKLASIDRVDFGHKYLPRMLTPDRVMYELRYRYDREIYRTQWPPLKRILEKNEDPAARIVLCVSSITVIEGNQNAPKGSNTPSAFAGPLYKMKLTDGWYCIDACIDAAMNNCIKNGKVKEGTKLMTVGAKAMNLNQGCSVLEIPGDVSLKIHTNSTRRVKWNTKLDYFRNNPGPMLLSLKSIKPNGGMICRLVVAVARLYPILYREKLPDGQFVFRNARCDEEAALAYEERHQAKMEEIYASARAEFQANLGNLRANERTNNRICMEQSFRDREDELRQLITSKLKECLPPPRDVTPVMKIRIAEGDTSAMLTVWSSERDTTEIFVEGSSVAIYNSFASRLRLNELQVTVGRSSFMKRETTRRIVYPERIFTSLIDVAEPGFNPVYGEFDTIGIVSSVGPAPHGMKNFDTVNLACPNASEDNASSFLSVLFWQGVSTHGYSKILTVGSLVACSNLEWRKNTAKSIPTAYCTERSVFSKNPRQNHLTEAFETLRRQIKEPFAYAATCATMIEEEIAKKASLRTPCKGTPYRSSTSNSSTPVWNPRDSRNSTSANCTPEIDSRKFSTKKRLEKLEAYGEPPKLPSIVINNSSRKVLSDFRSPVVTPVKKS